MGSNNKRRRLSELYVQGTLVKVDDGRGDPVEVWMQKLNPVDHDRALKRANAERARVLSLRSTPDATEYLSLKSEVHDLGERDTLVGYLAAEGIARAQVSREAELSAEDEWAKDSYLEGLRDAWEETLAEVYAVTPDDPEALRVFNELKRFADKVEADTEDEANQIRQDFEALAVPALQEKVIDRMLDLNADMAFMREFRRCEIWLAARDPHLRTERYFLNRAEVDELALEVLTQLLEAYRDLSIEGQQVKKLQEEQASSNSSGQLVKVATEACSGPSDAPPSTN